MERYLNLKNDSDYSNLKYPAEIIKNGGIIIFPTETVYAIGGNALNESSVKKIFLSKGREFKNPLNILVDSIKMLESVTEHISPLEKKLINAFFPGPFTIILRKNKNIPNIVTANSNYIGIRMPNNTVALKIIQYAGVPIAAPSANLSGKPSGSSFYDIYNDFNNKVDFMIDSGNCNIGIESTIVKVIDEVPHILRPGSITSDQIKSIANIEPIKDYENPSRSNLPSEHLNHYKLNAKSLLVYSSTNSFLINTIMKIASQYANPIILCSNKNKNSYTNYRIIDIGNNLDEIAKNLYSNLIKADKQNPDIIIIEGISSSGIGEAIMNRLIKSCDEFIEI